MNSITNTKIVKNSYWDLLPIELKEMIMKFMLECMRKNPRWVIYKPPINYATHPERMKAIKDADYITKTHLLNQLYVHQHNWASLNIVRFVYDNKKEDFIKYNIKDEKNTPPDGVSAYNDLHISDKRKIGYIDTSRKHEYNDDRKVEFNSAYDKYSILGIEKHLSNCKVIKLAKIYHETTKNLKYKQHLKFLMINEIWKWNISSGGGYGGIRRTWYFNHQNQVDTQFINLNYCRASCGPYLRKMYYEYTEANYKKYRSRHYKNEKEKNICLLRMLKDKKYHSKEMFKKYLAYDPK